jgi:Putative phage serine protease XkdF
MARVPLRKQFTVLHKDSAKRIIYGWASVSSVRKSDGTLVPYRDSQGDVMADSVLENMAHSYVEMSRSSKAMHSGNEIGHCIASLPMTQDVQDAMGVTCDRVGWFLGLKIDDDATWNRVVKGEFTGLSIGGFATYRE